MGFEAPVEIPRGAQLQFWVTPAAEDIRGCYDIYSSRLHLISNTFDILLECQEMHGCAYEHGICTHI